MKQFNLLFDEQEILKIKEQNIPHKSLLIQIFSSVVIKSYILNIVNFLKTHFPDAVIVGLTTDGEILNSKIYDEGVMLSFSFFENSELDAFAYSGNDLVEEGEKIAKRFKENSKLLFLYSSYLRLNNDDLVEGLKKHNRQKVPVMGALAADQLRFKSAYVIKDGEILKESVVGVIINSDVLEVSLVSIFGWSRFGKRMKITKCDKNLLYEIDNKNALEVYKYYLGEHIVDAFAQVGVEFPFIKTKEGMEIARVVLNAKDDKLILAGSLEEGDVVNFAIAEISKILNETKEKFTHLLKSKIEAMFIISCTARRRFVEKLSDVELNMIKNIPNVGFFGYGEFFNDYFLNQTLNALVMSEGGDLEDKKLEVPKNINAGVIMSLTHLVDVAFDEVRQKLYIDSVTSLPSKIAFDEDVGPEVYGVVMFDIKRFSNINDRYGEKVGDEVLRSFANSLKELIPNKAKLYNLGGDYFIVSFYKEENLEAFASDVLEYFYNNSIKVEIDSEIFDIDLDLYASVVEESDELRLKADMALHYAKKHGLDIVVYSKDLKIEDKIKEEIETLKLVKRAILEDRVIPVFQKILKDEPSYEALVRIEKENGELLSPFFFLDSIKNTRYYDKITQIMIEKSFRVFKDLPYKLSLNFSYEDIKNEKTIEFLVEKLEEYGMHNRVIIEVLETESIQELEYFEKFINKVKKYGVEIAIDDFGSGYSNFGCLVSIQPDYIKIDGSLIREIDKDEKILKIVKTIVEFAKSSAIKVVAEFVKDKSVYDVCKSIGIDGFQGYFIHVPSREVE